MMYDCLAAGVDRLGGRIHTPLMPNDAIATARRVRELLADKSGDDDWRRVPVRQIALTLVLSDAESDEAMADAILSDSYEPRHLIDVDAEAPAPVRPRAVHQFQRRPCPACGRIVAQYPVCGRIATHKCRAA